LTIIGPTIKHGVLRDARLIDIAPTVAQWLSLPLPLPRVEGRPLTLAE
jgi:hypothetical protein